GMCANRRGNFEEASRALAKSQRLLPMHATTHVEMALARKGLSDLDGALESAARAHAIRSDDVEVLSTWLHLLVLAGRDEDAWATLRPAIERHPDAPALGVIEGDLAPRFDHVEATLARLEGLLETTASPILRWQLLFRVARLRDRSGDADGAFEAYRDANILRPTSWDPAAHTAMIDEMIANWTPDAVGALPRISGIEGAVLIVGMPRSGTSLVEQILACHPGVTGGGELQDLEVLVRRVAPGPINGLAFATDPSALTESLAREMASSYRDRLRSIAPTGLVTDKMPFNVMHLGVVQAIAPRARIIHCDRGALDTCVSCYFHDFASGTGWTQRLEHIGRYHQDEARLRAHWADVLDLEILDVTYESVVADLEGQTRRMLDFLGLDFDEACLRFHESDRVVMTESNAQVRRPLYDSSVGRWARYEAHLGPLRESLGLD
ncbi:MAG: sulfotransferase, partial [Phycisphaerales bacterium]|nr:sulfotransferase [Phycisphaerales bacterium]